MNENIPPIPPAPQAPKPAPQYPSQPYPTQPPEGYGPPVYQAPPQAPQYVAAGYQGQPQQYGQPQGYAAPGPYPQPLNAPYPPQQYVPAPWAAGRPKPKSSGYRVAAGIVGIVLGTWLFIPSIAGFSEGGVGFMSLLILVAALGNITAGIVLLANQRNRNQGPPITSLSFAGLALLLGIIGLAVTYFGVALLVTTLLLAAPVLIVLGLGLSREKRGA